MPELSSFSSDTYELLELLERASILNWFLPTGTLVRLFDVPDLPKTPFSVYGFFFVPRSPGIFGTEWKVSKQEMPECTVIVAQSEGGYYDEQ